MIQIKDVYNILKNGIQSDEDRELLGRSMFYYCCGKDPTPVIAFGAEYPLYVYVDSLTFGQDGLESEVHELHSRLEQKGFRCYTSEFFDSPVNPRGNISQWRDDKNNTFVIVYIKEDAEKAFRKIYNDDDKYNYIQPKCICNIKYECPEFGLLNAVEKRVQYILGHSKSPKYKKTADVDYFGDYSAKTMGYFRRAYWYVF